MMGNHALKQLSALGYKEGDRVYLRSFHPEKGKDGGRNADFAYPELPIDLIEGWQQEGRGVYLVVNQGGHTDDAIDRCLAIFYEHDDVDEEGLKFLRTHFPDAEFEKKPDKKGRADRWLVPIEVQRGLWIVLGLPEPTMQIATGGKSLHSYWVFQDPIDVASWRKIQSDLLDFANADRKLKNPSRVMRLAGCLHASTGEHSKILAGCGLRYDFSELRSLIPVASEKVGQPGSVVTWTEFNQSWRYPILDSIPLEICLSRKNRDLLNNGEQDGGRNDSGFKLAVDLLAVTAQLVQDGQRFNGDPYDLFMQFCRRCPSGDGWNQREWDLIWKSAQSKSRNSSLAPEHIENCVKGWAWANCPNRQEPDVKPIGKKIPEAKPAILIDAPEGATDEEKLRLTIENYNKVLDAGDRFQHILLRRRLAKEWGLTVTEIDELSRYQSRAENEFASLEKILQGVCSEIYERAKNGIVPGVPTGFYDLDAMTQGLQIADLVIVAARPSIGKTSFVLNIGRNVAMLQHRPVVFFSLEMSRDALAYRLLSSETQIDSSRVRSGRVTEQEWDKICSGVELLSDAPIYIDDTASISTAEIRSKCRRLKSQIGDIGIVIVDYLQLMAGASEDPVNSLDRITAELKAIGREIQAPVIALSQLSRGVESRDNKRPTMSDIRASGGIEQNADLITMLYRDDYYNSESKDRGLAEVIIVKHRNGPVGTIELLFEPQFTQFRNKARSNGHRDPVVLKPLTDLSFDKKASRVDEFEEVGVEF